MLTSLKLPYLWQKIRYNKFRISLKQWPGPLLKKLILHTQFDGLISWYNHSLKHANIKTPRLSPLICLFCSKTKNSGSFDLKLVGIAYFFAMGLSHHLELMKILFYLRIFVYMRIVHLPQILPDFQTTTIANTNDSEVQNHETSCCTQEKENKKFKPK